MSAWTWRYHTADGHDTSPALADAQDGEGAEPIGTGTAFPSQADAETWVGETWRDLVQAGVESVTLLHDGEPVYGPMSLRPLE